MSPGDEGGEGRLQQVFCYNAGDKTGDGFLEWPRESGGDLTLVYLPPCPESEPTSCEQCNEEIETQNRRVSFKIKCPIIKMNNHVYAKHISCLDISK